MDDSILSSFFNESNIQDYLKGGKLGYGVVAITIPIIFFYAPLASVIPANWVQVLYIYLFYNGIVFLYIFSKEKFFQPKAICPHCKEDLKLIEISECPNCNTKLESNVILKCPNCGTIKFEK